MGTNVTLNKKLFIISILYFAEGFPFGLIEQTFRIYFRNHGMSLFDVGLLSLVALPYALKFLWAPAVDFLGSRRQWMAVAQFLLAARILARLPLDPSRPDFLLWAGIASLAILSATQDIAIDAYSIELLKPSEMGIANGFRQAAYRVAMVVSGGIVVALGGWIGWKVTYLCVALVLGMCGIISLGLPPVEVPRPRFSMVTLVAPMLDFVTRPRVIQVSLFILLYKLGDMSMAPMVSPFWLARGLSTTEIGLITGTFGILAAILGGLAGGLFMARFGIFHGLWFLGLWQAVSNLAYAWVAADPATGHWGVYAASVTESFCGGLGTAAFLAFLMSVCRKEFSASQYALLSALFRITGILAGTVSGWAADYMGYAPYFALTFLLSLPALIFVRDARLWIRADNNHNHRNDSLKPQGPPVQASISGRESESHSYSAAAM